MDTLTHALSGALVARATATAKNPPIPLGRRVGIGFVVGALPDIDVVASWLSPLAYLYYHRGITHSLVMLPLWALLIGWCCSRWWRSGPDWRAYAGVAALALGVHIAGDWITSFGTMLLAPFSDRRFGLGTTFIIDLWFSGIILTGLLTSLLWRQSRIPALAASVVLAGYVGLQYAARQNALDFAAQYARAEGIAEPQLDAIARPVSPFNWTLIVRDGERFHYSDVNVVREESLSDDGSFLGRLNAPYRPLDQAQWHTTAQFGPDQTRQFAREVWQAPEFGFFRWFAQHPTLYRVDRATAGGRCAWFQDLRFAMPGREVVPFR